jgi:lipase chaperone LimK
MPTTRQRLMIGAAALAAAVAVFSMRTPEPANASAPASQPDLFSFVRSLDGTVPDGRIDAVTNEFVASAGLVLLFDYYLSAIGEKPLEAIRTEIERELAQRLKPEAAAEAKRLLARYLAYKHDLIDVEKNAQAAGGSPQAIRNRFTLMQDARRRHFSEREIQAMFGDSDARDMDAIARLEIAQDASLNNEQKRERLAQLDATLPAAVREDRDEPLKVLRLEEAAQNLRAKGASDDDIYRMRAAALSPEAAARMAQVDREDREWRDRVAAYLVERNQLLADSKLPESERQNLLAQLQQGRFTPEEQRRLPAWEAGMK